MPKLAFNIGQEFKIFENKGIAAKTEYQTIGSLISTILPNVFVAAGLILFVILIFGAISFITASDSPEKKGKAAKTIGTTIVGFVIIFVSFWLIKLIEALTGINIFQPNI